MQPRQGPPLTPEAPPSLRHHLTRPAGPAQEVTAFHEETSVTFSPLSEELIREYTDSGEGW